MKFTGRPITPRWCPRDKAWMVPLGTWSETSRRHKYVVLRDGQGRKIERTDHVGRAQALGALLDRGELGPSVLEVVTSYLAWHETKGSKPTTIQDHVFHLDKFGRFEHQGVRHHDRPASSIKLRDLARVRESMEARGCQPGYIRHLYSSVLACWRWAARPVEGREPEQLLTTNPLEGIEKPRAKRARKVIVPWPTIEALLDFAAKRASAAPDATRRAARLKVLLLCLIAESGCRPLEACGLEWSHVHESERTIVIPAERSKTGWRTGSDRILGLTSEMAERLAQWRTDPDAHPTWVFAQASEDRRAAPSRNGLDHWFASLRDTAIRAGLPLPPPMTLYSLRHSLVTQARRGGVDYHDLAYHMGHSEQVAESIYSHPDSEFVRTRFDRMHAARSAPPKGTP